MNYFLITVIFTVSSYMIGHRLGQLEGFIYGKQIALSTNPVSEDLETTCAGLWIGEQNKKYVENNK